MARIDSDVVLGGRYRLGRRVASGGMGTVWEAVDDVLVRRVAVKVLSDALAADERFVERFRREARAAAGLSHPNVAGVFDYGEDDGRPFIVMELIQGETLAERLARHGRLPPEEAVRIAVQVAGALEAAHRAGVIHRDVKPANVMLSARGEVKVMDFGIAAAAWDPRLTATGSTLGTATYASPEQASGERASPASDVYSLGVVLYEMLAGRPPFTEGGPIAVASAHVRERPPVLAEVAPWTPPGVAAVCDRALAKDPADRPASAAGFARMLTHPEDATDGLRAEATAPLTDRAGPPARSGTRHTRRRLAGVLAGVLVLGLIAVLLLLGLNSGHVPAPAPSSHPPASHQGTVEIPRLRGTSLPDAVLSLTSLGLKLGPVKHVDGPLGVVVNTDPPFGSTAAPGAPVTLFVGDGHGPNKDHGKHEEKGGGD